MGAVPTMPEMDCGEDAVVTANQNNYALSPGRFVFLRTDGGSYDITGFAGPGIRQVWNVGASGTLVFKHESSLSDAGNRFTNCTGEDIFLGPGRMLIARPSYSTSRWLLVRLNVSLEARTADPASPANGDMWLRTDL